MKSNYQNTVFIGVGSNKGDRINNFQLALNFIEETIFCNIESISSLYESSPYGNTEQENFLNAVIKCSTKLNPQELLSSLKKIESKIGRIKNDKWGPREIDLDILFYNDLIFSNEIITLPHKGIIYRDFVLVPLIEIEPEIIHPVYSKKLSEFIPELKTRYIIKKRTELLFTKEKQIGI